MRNDEMFLQLYLIRHAESLGNIETLDEFDRTNPPLTVHGKKQAKALGERFSDFRNYTLYSSPLGRAVETAKNISDNIIIDDLLLEKGVRISGNSFEDFEESPEESLKRAQEFINKIINKHHNYENVIVVAHGMFIQSLLFACLGVENSVFRFSVYNASVSKVNFCETEPPKLALQNDISHLLNIDGEKLFWM